MIPALRIRLTAIYGGIFVVFVALLLGASYWLMGRHLHRTLDPVSAGAALGQLGEQYLLFLIGATLVACALGWAVAGRELASMQKAFDTRERFVANASHELRSPLTVIRTEADVALASGDLEELRSMGRVVIGAADELDALLDGLMLLARSGHGLQSREALDLGAVAAEAARSVPRAGVHARLDLQPVGVAGERRLLERLAANLVENGVRYNAPGGFVSVKTHPVDGQAVLDVVNSGPIVDPAVALRLTEPFERGGRTGTRGAGLGLSIVRSVAEAHGGRVSVRARSEGGLAVRVVLPANGEQTVDPGVKSRSAARILGPPFAT